MSESGPEHHGEELSTQTVIEALQSLANEGRIEFTDEDLGHVSEMELDEAIGYLMIAVAVAGEDPDQVLIEMNLVESIEPDEGNT